MLVLNNSTPVELCLAFLSHLRSFERSAIINVTSQAALQPVPFMAVYAASKSFLHNFSLALYEEWKSYGIAVHSLIPAPSETEFDEKAGAYATRLIERQPPTEAVQLALARMGEDLPVISSAKGLFKQRLANGLLPPKRLLHEVAKLFRPPNEN
jgi:short-subunit dehydrogenase